MHNSMIKSALAALVLGGLTTAARADLTYDWTETGSSFGNGSGTLTIDPTTIGLDTAHTYVDGEGYDYTVTSLTGTIGATAVSNNGGGDLNFSGDTIAGSSLIGAYVNVFDSVGNTYVLADQPGYNYKAVNFYPLPNGYEGEQNSGVTFTFTPAAPAAAPEPAQMVSGLVLAGLGLAARRFRSRK